MNAVVVFDYNGTLLNDVQAGWKACNHMLEHYGRTPVSFEEFRETYTMPWTGFLIHHGVRSKQIDVAAHQREWHRIYDAAIKKLLVPDKRIRELLEFLKAKGVRLGVLSSRNENALKEELAALGIGTFFEAIVGEKGLAQGAHRAEKETRELIAKMRLTKPEEVFYVGDTTADIKVARDHGFISIVVTNGWQTKERLLAMKPDFVMKDIEGLRKIV